MTQFPPPSLFLPECNSFLKLHWHFVAPPPTFVPAFFICSFSPSASTTWAPPGLGEMTNVHTPSVRRSQGHDDCRRALLSWVFGGREWSLGGRQSTLGTWMKQGDRKHRLFLSSVQLSLDGTERIGGKKLGVWITEPHQEGPEGHRRSMFSLASNHRRDQNSVTRILKTLRVAHW